MKKVNIFILICFSFILSGCTATYTLNVDITISDNLEISMSDSEYQNFNSDSNNYLIMQYANEIGGDTYNGEKIEGVSYYNMEKYDDLKKVVFSSKFNNSRLDEIALFKNTYRNYKLRKTEDELYIKTNTGFDFPYDELSSVRVILKSPYKVLYSNADFVLNDELIWDITKKNSDKSYIEVNYATDIKYDEEINVSEDEHSSENSQDEEQDISDEEKDTLTEETKVNSKFFIVILVFLSIIGIIVVIILKIKKNQLNKI